MEKKEKKMTCFNKRCREDKKKQALHSIVNIKNKR